MSKILYNLFIVLYSIAVRLAAAWNGKAAKWVSGRTQIFIKISDALQSSNDKRIWMHCASLGEFEQGRPLLEDLKKEYPNYKIVLTFFSPSGYEIMKDYKGADYIFYLPMDTANNAKQFLDLVNPVLVLWVKYEYWYYYLKELKKRNVPTLLVSGIFRDNQPFFKWYGNIWKQMLQTFTHFFVQNETSVQLLSSIGITKNVSINGDTRFDRVIQIANNFTDVPFVNEFCDGHKTLVAGSTWEEDEIELLHFVHTHSNLKFIIAPHEINSDNLSDVKDEFPKSIYYSEWAAACQQNNQPGNYNILIIDNVGMLSRLYKYAHVTYVGGGFGADGIHNVLEAAVYGKPVVHGPVFEKFVEAVGLLNAGGSIQIDGPVKLDVVLKKIFEDDAACYKMGDAAKKYVLENAGASKRITGYIQKKRLLTN